MLKYNIRKGKFMFQHTAARRRLAGDSMSGTIESDVSTHSRPKAAGVMMLGDGYIVPVSTHSRPKAAGKNC